MQNPTPNNAPTFESVWAAMQETDRQIEQSNRYLTEKFAETDQQLKETDRQIKESERYLKELFAESDRQFQETKAKTEKDRQESERRMKKMEELMGSWANNQGCFAEEYFF